MYGIQLSRGKCAESNVLLSQSVESRSAAGVAHLPGHAITFFSETATTN